MRVCNRCGRELPTRDFYLVKYKGQEPKARQHICKECVGIEQRRRYLLKHDPTNPQLEKINALYEKHAAAGRSVPTVPRRNAKDMDKLLDEMMEV